MGLTGLQRSMSRGSRQATGARPTRCSQSSWLPAGGWQACTCSSAHACSRWWRRLRTRRRMWSLCSGRQALSCMTPTLPWRLGATRHLLLEASSAFVAMVLAQYLLNASHHEAPCISPEPAVE